MGGEVLPPPPLPGSFKIQLSATSTQTTCPLLHSEQELCVRCSPSSQDPASLEQSSSLLACALRTFGLLLIKMMVIIYLAFSTMLSAFHILLHLILPYKVDIIILPFYK